MNWPDVDPREAFSEMEKRLGITEEINDVRQKSLGAHPSESFYCQVDTNVNLAGMRAKFDKAAIRY